MKTQIKRSIMNMLFYTLMIGWLIIGFNTNAQNSSNMGNTDNDSIVSVPYKKPHFPGEDRGLHKYLRENLIYPEIAKQNKIEGRVVCKFIVKEDGKVDDIKVVKSISPELDEEAIRVIKLMHEWIPAEKEDGEKVTSYCMMPIKFILGENKPPEKETVLEENKKMPSFPGGDSSLMEFLKRNIVYPRSAMEEKIEGKVVCRFVVDKNGKIGNIKVIESVSPALDDEAVRVIKKMPEWTPGEKNGERVTVYYRLPIRFNFTKNNNGECIGCRNR